MWSFSEIEYYTSRLIPGQGPSLCLKVNVEVILVYIRVRFTGVSDSVIVCPLFSQCIITKTKD